MKTISNVFKLRNWVSLSMGIIILSALSACGSDSTPIPDADPTGYYDVTGTATVKEANDTTDLPISDLQAMINDTRMIMMSTATGLLYDGTITNISENNFTADFTIYTNGENPVSATASGSITQGSSISGTLTGSGAGNGTFSLTYAANNNQLADLSRIANISWDGDAGAGTNYVFIISSQGVLTHQLPPAFAPFDGCETNGTVTPVSNTSLYETAVTLTNCVDTAVNGTTYTGLATSRTQTAVDDVLVFTNTNGSYSPNGELM